MKRNLYFCDTLKDIVHTDGTIAVHAMVCSDHEYLDNDAVVQTLPSN